MTKSPEPSAPRSALKGWYRLSEREQRQFAAGLLRISQSIKALEQMISSAPSDPKRDSSRNKNNH